MPKRRLTSVHVTLEGGQLEALDAKRAGVPCTRSDMIRLIVADWITRGRNFPLQRVKAGRKLDSIPPEHRPRVQAKLDVITGWRAARRAGRGRTEADVTADYILSLAIKGVVVGRSTLYLWDRRYRKRGAEGLIDYRGPLPLASSARGHTSTPAQRRAKTTPAQQQA